MTRADIERMLAEHAAGFAAREPERLAATHIEDGSFESPAVGLVRGRPAILNVYLYWYRAFPDFTLTWEPPIIDPPRAAVFWNFEGTAEARSSGTRNPAAT